MTVTSLKIFQTDWSLAMSLEVLVLKIQGKDLSLKSRKLSLDIDKDPETKSKALANRTRVISRTKPWSRDHNADIMAYQALQPDN